MKKQITILICVFVAAAVLLGVYLIFFRTGDQTTEDYYKISENALAIGNLEYDKVTITFAVKSWTATPMIRTSAALRRRLNTR